MKIDSPLWKMCWRCHLHHLDRHLIIAARPTRYAHNESLENTKPECRLHLVTHPLHPTQLSIGRLRGNDRANTRSLLVPVEAPQGALAS